MKPFQTLTSSVISLPRTDVDTDQIIPARYLKVTEKTGLADGLFAGWRYLPGGAPDLDFPLNRPELRGAQILLAGDNFGCGSSREHAPWALLGWGIRAVISSSFADIFRNNALKNGLLPLEVDRPTLEQLFKRVEKEPQVKLTIDLAQQRLRWPDENSVPFDMDPFNKTCLLEGVDQLGYLMKHLPQISAYERARA
ncbi:MAG: 3-isopropylmalate dehydratase small subunit [Anaerolineales bacterium]|jgi:3-isopropylmalate/(R)-2-methylmalate dehydratase small subunit